MTHYRIYLFASDGRIRRGDDAECDNDEDALTLAGSMIMERGQVEVWRGTKLIGQLCSCLQPDHLSSAATDCEAQEFLLHPANQRGN